MHANFSSNVPVAFRIHLWVGLMGNAVLLASHPPAEAREGALPNQPTVLGIQGTRFALNGRQTFLLGISYYGALGAPEEFIRHDLDDMQHHGFNWLRVWATWGAFDHARSLRNWKESTEHA